MAEGTKAVTELPFDAEWHIATQQKFQETVVFVHHQTGNKTTLKSHAKFINDLGLNAVTFSMHQPKFQKRLHIPVSADLDFGMKHYWADQITQVLNAIAGNKVVFSFSNPSSAAIEAIARRNAYDVKALICDGGPLATIFTSTMNYLKNSESKKPWLLRALKAGFVKLSWSPRYLDEIHHELNQLPRGFAILSIRGWRDDIVPPAAIDRIFSPHHHLDWRKLGLPEGGHLNGLRDFPGEYKPQVERFLKSVLTPVPTQATQPLT